jgi:hypothetical protein
MLLLCMYVFQVVIGFGSVCCIRVVTGINTTYSCIFFFFFLINLIFSFVAQFEKCTISLVLYLYQVELRVLNQISQINFPR